MDPLNLILLIVVGVIFYRLRSVLGTRNDEDGPYNQNRDRYGLNRDALNHADRAKDAEKRPNLRVVTADPPTAETPVEDIDLTAEGIVARGVASVKDLDTGFDEAQFLAGAEKAYEIILQAYAEGDKETLAPLLSDVVMESFGAAIDERQASGTTLKTEISRLTKPVIDDAIIQDGVVRICVRYIAYIATNENGEIGTPVRTEDLWTFERPLDSAGPIWRLISTETV